jgi:hypothetical protein
MHLRGRELIGIKIETCPFWVYYYPSRGGIPLPRADST